MKKRFNPEVTSLLDACDHPLRKEIDLLRTIILSVDKRIEEGVKWGTSSFRTTDWFATLNMPVQKKEPMIILHTNGQRLDMKGRLPDPTGLVRWLAIDRGQVLFKSAGDIKAKREALKALLHAWVQPL